MTDGWTDGRMDGPLQGPASGATNCAVAHPISRWILSYCLEGDRVTIGRTDGGDCNIPIAFIN